MSLPTVVLLTTGGTIVSSGANALQMTGYGITDFRPEDLVAAVPGAADVCRIEIEPVSNIDSSSMTSTVWMKLLEAVERASARPEVAGVVITHGTDTMEETAWFLNLTAKVEKPVVFTGAMRPATAMSADGPLNLLNALRVAVNPEAKGRGVLVVLNDVILSAREATKTHPTNVATFEGRPGGALGAVAGPRIVWWSRPSRPHTTETPYSREDFAGMERLPRVDIVYSHVDDDGVMTRAALDAGARAIVHAGTGNGSIHEETEPALFEAAGRGVPVLRGSRVGSGCVVEGLEAWQQAGFVPTECLNVQKARVLAQVVIAHADRTGEKDVAGALAKAFRTY